MDHPPRLPYERLCAEIATQAELLAGTTAGADLTRAVPSCPGWNVAQLLRHLGGGLRWAEEIVRTRPPGPPDDRGTRFCTPPTCPPPRRPSGWST